MTMLEDAFAETLKSMFRIYYEKYAAVGSLDDADRAKVTKTFVIEVETMCKAYTEAQKLLAASPYQIINLC